MDEVSSIVSRAQTGDMDAFRDLVRRFQNLAYGYAFSLLGDFHLAEDAAQEAFIDAYSNLAQVREPAAFAGWFRRVVYKQCDRMRRKKSLLTVPVYGVATLAATGPGPDEIAESE
jgi:RNA polymerase sigma factor (sigma-70 family)